MWPGVASPGYAWLQPTMPADTTLLGPGAMSFNPTVPAQMPMLQTQGPFNAAGAYASPVVGADVSANTTARPCSRRSR